MKRVRVLSMLGVLLSLGVSLSVPAAHAEKVLEGQVCSARVHALTSEIDWYKNLNKAENAAQQQGKLVFWMHMLGKIDGATWSAGNSLRAVSLSSDPAFSMLKDQFVCGFHDISHEKYAGASGKHKPDEQAVDTTNGAGPHNIQMFVLAPDGTVLTCLPGYWNPADLDQELVLAQQLYQVWKNPEFSIGQKKEMYSQMQLAHLLQHTMAERNRSRMQGFDIQFEAQKRLRDTDVFYNPGAVDPSGKNIPPQNVKTTDVIMHERLAMRPFLPYEQFDTDAYSSYGKNMYDKHEQFRDPTTGQVAQGANLKSEPFIGNDPRAHPIERQIKKQGPRVLSNLLRYSARAAMYAR